VCTAQKRKLACCGRVGHRPCPGRTAGGGGKREDAIAAGYSGTPLVKKLGIRPGFTVTVVGAAEGWDVPDLPPNVTVKAGLRGSFDVAIVFVRSAAELKRRAAQVVRTTADDASVWIAWPRKAGGHESDITENLLRDLILPTGLVDIKVAALDDDWPGLKFVRRKRLRHKQVSGARSRRE
jgi:hypothetical protein